MTAPFDADLPSSPFRLMVPGLAAAWRQASASRSVHLPALERMVRRGVVTLATQSTPGWRPRHLRLLTLLGLAADARHAGAPLEWLGLGGDERQGGWVQAEFVHVEVGTHHATLHAVTGLAVQESVQLAAALQAGLQFPGISVWPSPDPQRFAGVFLHSGDPFDVACPGPVFGEPLELRDVLPQGKHGPVLRRLLTEAQMVLHDHPVNADRDRRKARSANAVWLSGVGEFAGTLASSLPGLAGDGAYLKGLCRLHGSAARPVPGTADALLSAGISGVVELPVVDATEPAVALDGLERDWMAPLEHAVRAGHMGAIVLQLDDLTVRVDRNALRRFWRRGAALGSFLQ